jgi:CheY-like chemotaxis protein
MAAPGNIAILANRIDFAGQRQSGWAAAPQIPGGHEHLEPASLRALTNQSFGFGTDLCGAALIAERDSPIGGRQGQRMTKALIVDDEPLLILLATDELERAGFEVRSAFNGEEALAVLDADRDWDLLMTDIRMPGTVDGWALGRAARMLAPEVRIIYASGYVDRPLDLPDRECFMTKPYEIDDLKAALHGLGFEVDDTV